MREKAKIDLWLMIFLWLMNALFVVLGFFMPPTELWIYILFIMGFVGALTVIAFFIWGRRSKDVKIEDTEENLAAKEEAEVKS